MSPAAAKSCQSILSRLNLKASVVQHPSDRALRDTGIQLFQEATQICESTRLQTRFCVGSFNPDRRKILRSHHRHRRAVFLFSCPFIRQTDRRRDESTGRKTDGLKGRQTDRQRGDRQVWTGEQMEERATHRQAGRPTDGERDESVTFSNIQFKDQRHQNRFFFLFWTHTHTLTHTLSNSVVSSLSV